MKISKDFGIIIRRQALRSKSIDISSVMKELHFDEYFDETDDLISLGPFFGGDAADDCLKLLEKLGLCYIDDFFIFTQYIPNWCEIRAEVLVNIDR
ncbi:hypothetical protein [Herbaspirillum sp. alder98]|uniref:hypothetical protein n=1 Tax=Herbaspirillum sp. alder98 TaxID=2913096 RepID=UPI001CD8517B|nr:hypothetical protein [Herbaspirillum sp. alder98]MCA1326291.1 hypothetical protein [Herbaspirillum sp. alder98]